MADEQRGGAFRDLETPRLLLRGVGMADAAFLLRQFSNDEVNRYLFDAEPFSTLAEAEELVRFYTGPAPRNQHRWILCHKDTGERLGTCGFHCWNRALGEIELGYDLYPSYWKQGYMREALTAALAFAKRELGLRRVEAHVAEGNAASVRTLARQGFVDSGRTYDELFRGAAYLHRIYTLEF